MNGNVPFIVAIMLVLAVGLGLAIGGTAHYNSATSATRVGAQIITGPNTAKSRIEDVAEVCYKGVTYVVFNPGYNSSTASVELDRQSHVVACN
jgi:hypothetical protein